MPDAIFMFDVGLWITPTFRSARIGISASVGQTTWAAIVGPSKKPIESKNSMLVVPNVSFEYCTSKGDSDR